MRRVRVGENGPGETFADVANLASGVRDRDQVLGHGGHYLGVNPLLERFPGAKCGALPGVIKFMERIHHANMVTWELMFGDATVTGLPQAESLEGPTLYVDGSPLHVIKVEQADIHPTTVIHIPPSTQSGDSVYNEIHQMFGLSTPAE